MTAGTVVITGGILATVILLCIIAVLCYCRLQVSAWGPGPQAASKPLPQRGGNKAPSLESGRLVSRELDLAGWSEGSFPSACTRWAPEQVSWESTGCLCGVSWRSEISGLVGRTPVGRLKAAPSTPAWAQWKLYVPPSLPPRLPQLSCSVRSDFLRPQGL